MSFLVWHPSQQNKQGDVYGKYDGDANHCVIVYGYVDGQYWKIFDHYANTFKRASWDYNFGGRMRISFTKKTPMSVFPYKNNSLLKDSTRTQQIGLYLDGYLILDTEKDTDYRVMKEFIFRNKGIPTDRLIDVNAADWDAIPKKNLKGQVIA